MKLNKKQKQVISLMRKAKVETDQASPNFVAEFAANECIDLLSYEVSDISDAYELKRYKQSFSSNSEVCHVFASQSQPKGHSGSVFFEGDTIYSYGRHFPMARIETIKNEVVCFVTTRGYSVTTGKHLSDLRSAVRHLKVFYVDDVNDPMSDVDARAAAIIEGLFNTLNQTRPYFSRESVEDDVKLFNELCDLKNQKNKKIKIDQTLIDIVEEHVKYRDRRNEEIDKPKREAREAAQKQAELERAVKLEAWCLGENVELSHWHYDEVKLRIKGSVVETSRGAKVPLKAAKALWSRIQAAQATQGDRVGSYSLNKYDSETVVIGCHDISVKEIERVLGPALEVVK